MNTLISNLTRRFLERIFIFLLLFGSILASPVFADGSVFVSSAKSKVFLEPDFNSPIVTELKQGSKLSVIQKKSIWIQVALNGQNGWVSKYSVSETMPIINKISIFSRVKNFFRSSTGRDRTSVVSTAGGIRGLSDGEVASSGGQDHESLEKIEAINIDPQDLENFIQSNEK